MYLVAEPGPAGAPLGRSLDAVAAAVRGGLAALLLGIAADDGTVVLFGRLTLGDPLDERTDAELAFDPIRNTTPDLHPTGTVHGTRAFAYRISARWRGAQPPAGNPAAVARTVGHR